MPSSRSIAPSRGLIGPETVDTIPPATMDAFRDHGRPRASLQEGTADAVIVSEIMLVVLAVVGALTGVIAVISAIGLSTTVALSTRLRAREIATTRILGQNRGDAARAILIEGAVTSAAATLSGLAVGSVLGWVGAQSVLGSTLQSQLVTPVVPVLLVGVIAVVALVLTALSTIAPMRFVLADSPMRAFARA